MENSIIALMWELGAWNWLILAGILLALELVAPGVFFIWLAAAAAVVGGVALTTGLGWQLQLILFVVLAIIAAMGARVFLRRNKYGSEQPLLTRRALQYVGRTYELAEPIKNGRGKVRIGDTLWLVEGEDMPKGRLVTVTGAESSMLQVEPAES